MKILGLELRYLIIYKKYERIEIYWTEIEETIEGDFYHELLNSLIKQIFDVVSRVELRDISL